MEGRVVLFFSSGSTWAGCRFSGIFFFDAKHKVEYRNGLEKGISTAAQVKGDGVDMACHARRMGKRSSMLGVGT